ncbi:hypothetical protein QZH41_000924 [Actinostola sp. cb2023]|nr:hypothetical protein QZH41_000924 [Actinostola sp. cb2023]
MESSDFFNEGLSKMDIAAKESYGLLYTLQSFMSHLCNSREVAQVDSRVLLAAMNNEGCKNHEVNNAMKKLHTLVQSGIHVSPKPGRCPPRRISDEDVKLSPRLYHMIDQRYGGQRGHTIDHMALDSNAQKSVEKTLPHYTPFDMPEPSGVDFSAQNPAVNRNGDRPSDLSNIMYAEIQRMPNDKGILFHHVIGKTRRGSHSNVFGILRHNNLKICPVKGIEDSVATCRAIQINLYYSAQPMDVR